MVVVVRTSEEAGVEVAASDLLEFWGKCVGLALFIFEFDLQRLVFFFSDHALAQLASLAVATDVDFSFHYN